MIEFVNFFTSILSKYVGLLFDLPLMDGVSVGSFMLGCSIMSIMLGYLIGRFILSGNEAESMGKGARVRSDKKKDG